MGARHTGGARRAPPAIRGGKSGKTHCSALLADRANQLPQPCIPLMPGRHDEPPTSVLPDHGHADTTLRDERDECGFGELGNRATYSGVTAAKWQIRGAGFGVNLKREMRQSSKEFSSDYFKSQVRRPRFETPGENRQRLCEPGRCCLRWPSVLVHHLFMSLIYFDSEQHRVSGVETTKERAMNWSSAAASKAKLYRMIATSGL